MGTSDPERVIAEQIRGMALQFNDLLKKADEEGLIVDIGTVTTMSMSGPDRVRIEIRSISKRI